MSHSLRLCDRNAGYEHNSEIQKENVITQKFECAIAFSWGGWPDWNPSAKETSWHNRRELGHDSHVRTDDQREGFGRVVDGNWEGEAPSEP